MSTPSSPSREPAVAPGTTRVGVVGVGRMGANIARRLRDVETSEHEWDRYFQILQAADPYGRLCSIHHSRAMYDHARAWVTHASVQGDEFQKTPEWREAWHKPVIFDECKYETWAVSMSPSSACR